MKLIDEYVVKEAQRICGPLGTTWTIKATQHRAEILISIHKNNIEGIPPELLRQIKIECNKHNKGLLLTDPDPLVRFFAEN